MDAEHMIAIEEGLAIKELKRQSGWGILENKIQDRIDNAVTDMRNIELENRTLQDIGAEYVSKAKLIDGLNQVFEIIRDIEAKKEEAETIENDE